MAVRLILVVAVLGMALAVTPTASADLRPGSTHSLTSKAGGLAMPQPRLGRAIELHRHRGGGATVSLSIAYAVANTRSRDGVRPDRARLRLTVARRLFTTGPQPDRLVATRKLTDRRLDRPATTRRYRFRLSRAKARFLARSGFWSRDAKRRAAARRLVNVGVWQQRDFARVDGRYDWIQTATFDASRRPLAVADDPGGALTITNDTEGQVWAIDDAGGYIGSPQAGPGNTMLGKGVVVQAPATGAYESVGASPGGVTLAMTGQAVSCSYQGNDGSNPNGFNSHLPPGVSITATLVADDSKYDKPNDSEEAASISNAALYALQAEVAVLSTGVGIAFGGPFALPVSLALDFLPLGGNCDNQPNIFQIGILAPDGFGAANVNWAIWDDCDGQCGGMANVYNEPWNVVDNDAQTMVNNAVGLVPSTTTYQGSPLWLAQVWTGGCGVGDANDSNVSGCTSQNTMSLRWTTTPACPWAYYSDVNGGPYGSWCNLSAPSAPAIPYCGPGNAGCPGWGVGAAAVQTRP